MRINKPILTAIACLFIFACSNNAKTEVDEQKQRDSLDAAQRIKDSLDVEAKIMADMAADTTGAKVQEAPATN